MSRPVVMVMFALVAVSISSGFAQGQEPPAEPGKAEPGKAEPGKGERAYRHQWALIVGIDYRKSDYDRIADRPKVPELSNPEKDAKDFSDLLQRHYGYKKEHIVLLQGREASHQAISKNLGNFFVCHPDKISAEDSVLVYCAGHGDREEGGQTDRGYFIPADLEYHLDQPVEYKMLHFHKHIVAQLKKCPARHKLLILDCCHSGEIFNVPLPPFNISDDRANVSAFRDTAVQAIASCRGTQEAGDGRQGANSPFLTALKRSLTTLPVRSADAQKFLPVSRVFLGMTPDFQYMPRHQSPSLRSLAGEDGEFHFFPKGNFEAYVGSDADVRLMQAMVPGEHGNWWFDETPWMIPSLRQAIVGEFEPSRTKTVTHFIHTQALRECAREAIKKRAKQPLSPLLEMRFRHLAWMIEPPRGVERQALLTKIAEELREHKGLQAADIHFLAVLEQSLNDKHAADTYERALAAYAKARTEQQPSIMEALCRSDFGNYEIEVRGDVETGIRQLNEAYRLVELEYGSRKESPLFVSPFCIYLRCRKADGWQRLKVWGEADNDLDVALQLARDLDHKHPLTSFVHRRRAWARMEQWRFQDAIKEFQLSTAILEGKADLVSRIAELHNRHGLAMAQRFQGQPIKAIAEYRQLVMDIGDEFRKQANRPQESFSVRDLRALLAERYVNSHERLVDCNLFGPPEARDLAEAVDDIRRGLRACPTLQPHRRSLSTANLLYKQAIALSLPSPVQDAELARECCDAAQKLYEEAGKPGELEYQHTLAAPLVDLFAHGGKKPNPEQRRPKLAALREAIQTLEGALRQNANRDHLEFLMFSSKILLEEGLEADQRYLLLQDAERLQSLCRRALTSRKSQGARKDEATGHGAIETLVYLRPYHESIIKARLQLNPKHVKALLEVQWEATMGSSYPVPVESQPTLALLVVESKCYLFVDIPRTAGKVFLLDNDVTCDELRAATLSVKAKLRLPREALRDLESWTKSAPNPAAATQLCIRWRDPVRGLGEPALPQPKVSPQVLAYACPFDLPSNWRWTEPPAIMSIGSGGGGTVAKGGSRD